MLEIWLGTRHSYVMTFLAGERDIGLDPLEFFRHYNGSGLVAWRSRHIQCIFTNPTQENISIRRVATSLAFDIIQQKPRGKISSKVAAAILVYWPKTRGRAGSMMQLVFSGGWNGSKVHVGKSGSRAV